MKLDIRNLQEILRLATMIVVEVTPQERSRWSYQAYVNRQLLNELEQALIAAGIDVSSIRKRAKQIANERAQRSATSITAAGETVKTGGLFPGGGGGER